MNGVIWSRAEEVRGSTTPCLLFRPQGDIGRLPIVYLLHGQFDTEEDWFGARGQLPGILTGLNARPMILVMPFCAAGKRNPGRDQQDPELKPFAETFASVVAAVRPLVGGDDHPTAVVGISMGGRQALHLVLTGRIPGVSALGVLSAKLQEPFRTQLADLVDDFRGGLPPLRLYFHYCGSGGKDEPYLPGNQDVCRRLGGRLRTRQAADHSWWFWRPALAEFFREFDQLAAEPAVAADRPAPADQQVVSSTPPDTTMNMTDPLAVVTTPDEPAPEAVDKVVDYVIGGACAMAPVRVSARMDQATESTATSWVVAEKGRPETARELFRLPAKFFRSCLARIGAYYLDGQLYGGYGRRRLRVGGRDYAAAFYLSNEALSGFWVEMFFAPLDNQNAG